MRNTKGFTLIELLIVVVIIGILAAIAIPKFSATREKAYASAMKSDLKNLASQQEIYYADYYTYANTLNALGATLSQGVGLQAITSSNTGYSVLLNHSGLQNANCGVHYGTATAVVANAQPGAIACTGGF